MENALKTALISALCCGAFAQSAQAQSPMVSPTASTDSTQQGRHGHSWGGGHGPSRDPIKVTANSPLWERYLAQAQTFQKQGDLVRAKQYYFEALSRLEKSPRVANHLTGKISRLQGGIMSLYPRYPREQAPGEGAAQIKMDEEEIAVLQRLNRINQMYPNGSPLPTQLVDTQIRFAQQDLSKNKAAAAEGGKKGSIN